MGDNKQTYRPIHVRALIIPGSGERMGCLNSLYLHQKKIHASGSPNIPDALCTPLLRLRHQIAGRYLPGWVDNEKMIRGSDSETH